MSADAMSPVPIPGLGGGRMTWAGRLSAADPGLGRLLALLDGDDTGSIWDVSTAPVAA